MNFWISFVGPALFPVSGVSSTLGIATGRTWGLAWASKLCLHIAVPPLAPMQVPYGACAKLLRTAYAILVFSMVLEGPLCFFEASLEGREGGVIEGGEGGGGGWGTPEKNHGDTRLSPGDHRRVHW